MKKLEKILIFVALFSAIASMIINMYSGNPWVWQFIASIWIMVAFLKMKLIDRYESLVDKMTKK